VPTPTDDRRDLLTVIAYMRACGPGQAGRATSGAGGADRAHKQGEGVRQLRPAPGHRGPRPVFFYENWESGTDLDAHLDAPHLRDFAARIPELLDDSGLSVNRVRRIA
jgi:hypothetical protein